MRTLRKVIDITLPLAGVAAILAAVLLVREDLRIQLAWVGFGMLLIEVGVWKLAHPLLPSGRRYWALRAETDTFLRLVRELNSAAVAMRRADAAERRQSFEEALHALRQSVERMARVAGKTNAELAAGENAATTAGAAGLPAHPR